ncbi:MAG: hypothetical protein DBX91_00880 [Subdoligranulum variabile]|nr:MAG: hypothetical protein DBX91_00880 [Subdoligranulum variabile]
MKKPVLIALTFVPVAVGALVNVTLALPGIGSVLFVVLPLLTTVFWAWLGARYGKSAWKPLPALLIGNAVGIVSLLVYLWQYLLVPAAAQNLALVTAAQLFLDAAPLYLLGHLAVLFEAQPQTVGTASMVAMHVLSFVYMAVVFGLGFLWGRKTGRG